MAKMLPYMAGEFIFIPLPVTELLRRGHTADQWSFSAFYALNTTKTH